MLIHKIIKSIIITSMFFGLSTLANAEDVKFSNHSKYDLLIFHNDYYPTVFLKADTTVTFNEATFTDLCKNNISNCDFYISKSGIINELATITFDEKNVVSIKNTLHDVFIEGSGSDINIKNR